MSKLPSWVTRRPAQFTDEAKPYPGEIEEAKRFPNQWIYRVAGFFKDDEFTPPEAIVGAWKVDEDGNIVGEVLKNEKYDAKRWPAG